MQHRYVGDIGDYIKLGILRALASERRLGVAWWLHPDEGAPGDGRHIGYLEKPSEWRAYDPALFDHLRSVVRSGRRDISALENEIILPGTTFHSEALPVNIPPKLRAQERRNWFESAQHRFRTCGLLFLDPDNGLEPRRYRPAGRKSGKSVMWAELEALRRPDRPLIVYHHQTRFKGGHLDEIRHLAISLRDSGFRQIDALRASPYSPRVFFLLDGDSALRDRAAHLCHRWSERLSWHADL
jgi:hypothetical protein